VTSIEFCREATRVRVPRQVTPAGGAGAVDVTLSASSGIDTGFGAFTYDANAPVGQRRSFAHHPPSSSYCSATALSDRRRFTMLF
jgi:hypothetical protein